jgi:protoporphyrinogen/coproporphyrinogen III oxidase
MKNKHIVVIGGGIAGLSAAYYLKKEIDTKHLPYSVKLLEATSQLGGKIKTFRKDGFIIEQGPDSILFRKQSAFRLAKNLGLDNEVVRNSTGQSYILANGRLHKMPEGSFMGIPTKITPFALSGLFSWKGKLRAAGDFFLPKSEPKEDQSLGLFFRRRFGNEVVENLVEPLLSGIYAGDIDELSLMSTFPNFYQLEQKYRSLIKGLKQTMPKVKTDKNKPKQGQFFTLKSGLRTFIEALEKELNDVVMKEAPVQHVEKDANQYKIYLANGEYIEAAAIIISCPHFAMQKMFSQYTFLAPFKEMKATSVATVAMAFDKEDIKQDIDGTGFVISRNSDHRITAVTWTHKKWPHTTPDGKALVRCYVGRPNDQEVVDLSDEEIEQIVLTDLNKTMNITAKPHMKVISRFKNAMPQYSVGHKMRVETLEKEIKDHLPGVFLAGSSFNGVGIPDCIDQSEKAVLDVLNFLGQKNIKK